MSNNNYLWCLLPLVWIGGLAVCLLGSARTRNKDGELGWARPDDIVLNSIWYFCLTISLFGIPILILLVLFNFFRMFGLFVSFHENKPEKPLTPEQLEWNRGMYYQSQKDLKEFKKNFERDVYGKK